MCNRVRRDAKKSVFKPEQRHAFMAVVLSHVLLVVDVTRGKSMCDVCVIKHTISILLVRCTFCRHSSAFSPLLTLTSSFSWSPSPTAHLFKL